MSFNIIGTGRCLPEFILSNEKLTTMLDTSDEWISTRTGIKNRHIATNETILQLATNAAKSAINNANLMPDDIDMIICSCVGADYKTPSLSCLVQKEVGITNDCPAFDVNAACTGFIYALDIADAFFKADKVKNVLVVSAEMMSKFADWEDRATCVLFGDGAGAVVLTKGENLLSIKTTAKGDDKLLMIGDANGNSPFNTKDDISPYLKMNGGEVFKFAVASLCRDIKDVAQEAGITIEDIAKIIPHQANMRILKSAKERLKLGEGKIVSAIERIGNTSSASIPIVLSELFETGEIKKGDILALTAFGGGLTTGACIIRA